MNSVNLIGRLTKDAEIKSTQSGKELATLTLAVNRRFKSDGQQSADFIRCQAWGKTAEIISKYTHKGSQIGVSGRIQTRDYENQQGQRVYVTEVVADSVDLLESKPADNTHSANAQGFEQRRAMRSSESDFGSWKANTYQKQESPTASNYGMPEDAEITSEDLPF